MYIRLKKVKVNFFFLQLKPAGGAVFLFTYLKRSIEIERLLGFFLFAASSLRHVLIHFSGEVLFFYGGIQIDI